MHNRSSTEAATETPAQFSTAGKTDSSVVIPASTVAIFALVISALSFIKSLRSDVVSHRNLKAQTFENNFGVPVRDEMRSFERSLKTLNAFTLSSGRSAEQLIEEIESTKMEWFDAAYQVTEILNEVDSSVLLKEPHWANAFGEHADSAENVVNMISLERFPTSVSICAQAREALDKYRAGIAVVRTRLKNQTARLSKVKL